MGDALTGGVKAPAADGWIGSSPPAVRSEGKMAMDVWSAGEEVALSEVCGCIEPLLLDYLLNETHDAELAQELLDQTFLRVQFGAYAHGTDVVGWALEIASRLAVAHRSKTAPALTSTFIASEPTRE
jgi:hypothetical protein